MDMLYDSDHFMVVYIRYGPEKAESDGFEIIDKKRDMSVFLANDWADAFNGQIKAWQAEVPEKEEVEGVLEKYAKLAQNPLCTH